MSKSVSQQLQFWSSRFPFTTRYYTNHTTLQKTQLQQYRHTHQCQSLIYSHSRFLSSVAVSSSSSSSCRLSPVEQREFLSNLSQSNIRNFSIIAHIDHGKSTLADRLLELGGNISLVLNKNEAQVLDKLQVERERGITVKAQTASIFYKHQQQPFLLNLIDTPGHVDFSYEVSRSLAACQGAILLVDATQGIQAQTLANYHSAIQAGLDIIPVLTKIDLPHADIHKCSIQMQQALNIDPQSIIAISSKSRINIEQIFPAIVERIRSPAGKPGIAGEVRALLFDSWYDSHRGVVCLVNVIDGVLTKGDAIATYHENHQYEVQDLGLLMPHPVSVNCLSTGQVGYLIAGIRSTREAKLGDTIYRTARVNQHRGAVSQNVWQSMRSALTPLPGFAPAKPMVFAGLFPSSDADFEHLSIAIDKLLLNDASVSIEKESSIALGLGFRCGFLGVLHMDVFSERLEQEFGASVIITAPTVPYIAVMKDDSQILLDSPSKFPDSAAAQKVSHYLEPMVLATIITPLEYQGSIMQLCQSHRGELLEIQNIGDDRSSLRYQLPLAEIVIDLYDQIKTLSSGYASFDYQLDQHELSDLVKLDIKINGNSIDALSLLTHNEKVELIARKIVLKLKETIERQSFEIIIQACMGKKVIARERISPYRKDVLVKSGKTVGGGDVTRKRKLLEKQKEGKKRMKMVGNVELNQEVFTAVMKL